jgi:hypothetical protein
MQMIMEWVDDMLSSDMEKAEVVGRVEGRMINMMDYLKINYPEAYEDMVEIYFDENQQVEVE